MSAPLARPITGIIIVPMEATVTGIDWTTRNHRA